MTRGRIDVTRIIEALEAARGEHKELFEALERLNREGAVTAEDETDDPSLTLTYSASGQRIREVLIAPEDEVRRC